MLLSKLLPNLMGRDFDLICVGESIRQLVCSVVSIVFAAGCSGRILLCTVVITCIQQVLLCIHYVMGNSHWTVDF